MFVPLLFIAGLVGNAISIPPPNSGTLFSCTKYFKSTPFYANTFFIFFTKQATLMSWSTVLSFHPHLLFPDAFNQIISVLEIMKFAKSSKFPKTYNSSECA
jgi:hypothetical protein